MNFTENTSTFGPTVIAISVDNKKIEEINNMEFAYSKPATKICFLDGPLKNSSPIMIDKDDEIYKYEWTPADINIQKQISKRAKFGGSLVFTYIVDHYNRTAKLGDKSLKRYTEIMEATFKIEESDPF